MQDRKIAIIGGGASGLFASIIAKREGLSVDLYEKNNRLARKLAITGKGRCNLTTNSDKESFFKALRRNGKFLYSSFSAFDNFSTMTFFEQLGVKLKIERGGRVFPESDSAKEICDALINEAKRLGVNFHLNEEVLGILPNDEGSYTLKLKGKNTSYQAILVATGGASYPLTGSTGKGYDFAKTLKLKVEPIRGALIPLVAKEKWIGDLQGLSLKNVQLTLKTSEGKKIGSDFGEMLFTHYGISGPIVLSLSGFCTDYWQKEKASILASIDLKPALSHETLFNRIEREIEKEPKKAISTVMRQLLPQSMIAVFLDLAQVDKTKVVCTLSKKEKLRLVETLKNFNFTLTESRPLKEAIITAGGLSIKEVEPKTMMVKNYPGLFFIGEVLDVDAYTGGFNLQIAFSTAYAAAKASATYLKGDN